MTMRHEYNDPKGRMAPSILKSTVVEAIGLSLGSIQSYKDKDKRLVLNEKGKEALHCSFGDTFMYVGNPVNYTTAAKVSRGELLGDEIIHRNLIATINAAKEIDGVLRAEIRFEDKEKQALFLDTIENAISHIKAKIGEEHTKQEMVAACVQLVFEGLVDWQRNQYSVVPPASDEDVRAFISKRKKAKITEDSNTDDRSMREEELFSESESEFKALYWQEKYRRNQAETDLEKAKEFARQILALGSGE